jgi:hypothetical protein
MANTEADSPGPESKEIIEFQERRNNPPTAPAARDRQDSSAVDSCGLILRARPIEGIGGTKALEGQTGTTTSRQCAH